MRTQNLATYLARVSANFSESKTPCTMFNSLNRQKITAAIDKSHKRSAQLSLSRSYFQLFFTVSHKHSKLQIWTLRSIQKVYHKFIMCLRCHRFCHRKESDKLFFEIVLFKQSTPKKSSIFRPSTNTRHPQVHWQVIEFFDELYFSFCVSLDWDCFGCV